MHKDYLGGQKKERHSGLQGVSREKIPRDIAPLLYAKMKKKKRTVPEAQQNSTRIRDLDYRTCFTTTHLSCHRVAVREGRSNNLDSNRAWRIHYDLGLQGIVHIENMGTTKVQILHVDHHHPK
jgi:hypothetical protein